MAARLRFAPSPTGLLHVGNAYVALANWLHARRSGGGFILRIDDTDRGRSRPEFEEAIRADLAWLGLGWDAEARQSDRLDRYAAAMEQLKASGRAYPCYESAEELAEKRRRQLARHQPPIYDRAALELTDADRRKLEAEGRRPHWRFRLEAGQMRWDDLVEGAQAYDARHLSDPVLLREDGVPLYTLTSVVDDIELAISQVVRGRDHVTNTAVQIQLFGALGGAVPEFGHLPLLLDAEGHGLSKRIGSLTLASIRDRGIEPMALANLLAQLGAGASQVPAADLAELARRFDLARLGRAAPRFDLAELDQMNARQLHAMPFATARERLLARDIEADEAFWLAVRGNLRRFAEAEAWWRVCRAVIAPAIEDADYARLAAGLLPPEPWSGATWKEWTGAVAKASARKGRDLFHPLRLALTGRGDGPELAALLPLIGRDRAAARLLGRTA